MKPPVPVTSFSQRNGSYKPRRRIQRITVHMHMHKEMSVVESRCPDGRDCSMAKKEEGKEKGG